MTWQHISTDQISFIILILPLSSQMSPTLPQKGFKIKDLSSSNFLKDTEQIHCWRRLTLIDTKQVDCMLILNMRSWSNQLRKSMKKKRSLLLKQSIWKTLRSSKRKSFQIWKLTISSNYHMVLDMTMSSRKRQI